MKDNDGSENETEYFSEGGIVRQVLKIKKSYIRSIAKHSDKLSDISDVVLKVSSTISDKVIDSNNYTDNKSNNNSNSNNGNSSGKSSINNNNNDNIKNGRVSRIIRSLPLRISIKDGLLVVSNVIVGSLSFYPYENNVGKSPVMNGIIGGVVSGILTTVFDRLILTRTRRKYFGTILSHAVSFSVLFSSYEITKGLMYNHLSKTAEDEISLYLASGLVAGICSETFNHILSPLETATSFNKKRLYLIIRQQIKSCRGKSILLQGIPSSLGFLAYEFGRKN